MGLAEFKIVGAAGWVLAAGVLGAVAIMSWLLASWASVGAIANLERRLSIAEARERGLARLFHGRTPEEVAERLGALEARLAALPPRRLADEQRKRLAEAGPPPAEASYLHVEFDRGSAETRRYAEDLVESFRRAPGWNVVSRALAHVPPLPSDVAVGLIEPESPTASETHVLTALAEAGITHGRIKSTASGAHVQIIVATR
jgi:hypothetical protein